MIKASWKRTIDECVFELFGLKDDVQNLVISKKKSYLIYSKIVINANDLQLQSWPCYFTVNYLLYLEEVTRVLNGLSLVCRHEINVNN